jgi:hypothetical protein
MRSGASYPDFSGRAVGMPDVLGLRGSASTWNSRVGYRPSRAASVVGMKATVMCGAGDVRIENLPEAKLIEPTDALARVTRACICDSDLWPYTQMTADDARRVTGHEAIGVVDPVDAESARFRARARLRPNRLARRGARGLPADERARSGEVPDQALVRRST